MVRKCDLKSYFQKTREFQVLLQREEYFTSVKTQLGGYGVEWDYNMTISDSFLYRTGHKVPRSVSDFKMVVKHNIVNVSEAAEILSCSRQNIEYLTRTDKLHSVKISEKNTLYLKSEINKPRWKLFFCLFL